MYSFASKNIGIPSETTVLSVRKKRMRGSLLFCQKNVFSSSAILMNSLAIHIIKSYFHFLWAILLRVSLTATDESAVKQTDSHSYMFLALSFGPYVFL